MFYERSFVLLVFEKLRDQNTTQTKTMMMSNKRQKLTQPEEKDIYTSIMQRLPYVLRSIVHSYGANHRGMLRDSLIDIRLFGKAVKRAQDYAFTYGDIDRSYFRKNYITISNAREMTTHHAVKVCRTCESITDYEDYGCDCFWTHALSIHK